jgi:pyridoxamine-phosphate oxidase
MNVFEQLRKEYITQGLQLSDLVPDPMVQFEKWFLDAIEKCPVDWIETNAMTLSTSAGEVVTNRTVLLKEYQHQRFVFFTHYQSEKGKQLQQNPRAALLFYWPWLDRQVRITGSVEKTSREVSEKYFHSRSRGSQLGASISAQSQPLASREILEQQCREIEQHLGQDPVPLPDNWGGYALQPNRFEFWQGRLNRMHDRFLYTCELDENLQWQDWPDWEIQRLYP